MPVSGDRAARPPRLYLMIGVPGSGKTTYARTHLRDSVRVSLDDLRLMISGRTFDARFEPQVSVIGEAALDASLAHAAGWGRDVVFDATNVTRALRHKSLRLAAGHGLDVVAIWIETPIDVARERNRRRRFPVPEDVVDRFYATLEPPTEDEGFIEVRRIVDEPRGAGST